MTGNIEVLPAQIGAIVFDEVTLPDGVTQTDSIFIRKSGGTSSARVVFQVLDVLGQPAPDQTVSFSLTSTVGDIQLQNTEGLTDSDGNVAAIVSAGFIATTVRVRASLDADTDDDGDNTDFGDGGAQTLATLSDQLSINTGIADQNSFTLAATELNFEGNNFDGETVTLTGFLADRFNNPVSGTAIQFRSEFGTIEPSCTTGDNGSCTVQLTSTDPRGPLDTNVSNEEIAAGNCPNTLIVEEVVELDGDDGDTEYIISAVHRVESTADVAIDADDYTLKSDGTGIECTGAGCPASGTDVKITYTRAFPDEDDTDDTDHEITNPGQATAPFLTCSGPCLTFSVDQGGDLSSGYIGGLGQRYGARSTILAFAQGEESFIDSNGNGLYDFEEPFVDLTEAFLDSKEDDVFGNGDPTSDDSRDETERDCYGPASPLSSTASSGRCFQIGGEEEEPVDFNENGIFDAGNGIYNGTLCPLEVSDRTDTCDNNTDPCDDEANEQYCTRDLVSINKEAVIIFSGSFASFALHDAATGERIDSVDIEGTGPVFGTFRASSTVTDNDGDAVGTTTDFEIGHDDDQVVPGIGDTVSLTSGTGSVIVYFADTFNQQMPAGTTVNVSTSTGGCLITNSPGGSVLSTNSAGVNSVFITLARDTTSTDNGTITTTLTTPNGATSTFSFACVQN